MFVCLCFLLFWFLCVCLGFVACFCFVGLIGLFFFSLLFGWFSFVCLGFFCCGFFLLLHFARLSFPLILFDLVCINETKADRAPLKSSLEAIVVKDFTELWLSLRGKGQGGDYEVIRPTKWAKWKSVYFSSVLLIFSSHCSVLELKG